MATFAPPLPEVLGLGSRGGRVGEAWRDAWKMLSRGEWVNADEIADKVGPANDMKPESVRKMLSFVEGQGFIIKEYRLHPVTVRRLGTEFPSRRQRVWYRVSADKV